MHENAFFLTSTSTLQDYNTIIKQTLLCLFLSGTPGLFFHKCMGHFVNLNSDAAFEKKLLKLFFSP